MITVKDLQRDSKKLYASYLLIFTFFLLLPLFKLLKLQCTVTTNTCIQRYTKSVCGTEKHIKKHELLSKSKFSSLYKN